MGKGKQGMKPGDTVLVKSLTTHTQNAQFTFKAPKGKGFVLLVLGATDLEPKVPFDANAALESFGWELRDKEGR